MTFLLFLFGIFLALGMFLLTADLLRLPRLATQRAMLSVGRQEKKQARSVEALLMGWAIKLAPHIHMDEYKRGRLKNTLAAAGLNMTPEEYTAFAMVKTGAVLLTVIPCLLIFPMLALIVVLLAVAVYFKEIRRAEEKLSAKRDEIEAELPRFVATITQELAASRDVLSMIEHYKQNSGPVFSAELDVLTADMRSGSYEAALTRFEARFNSPLLSDIVRGLIGVLRGDNGVHYFQMLSHDMKQLELQRLYYKFQGVMIATTATEAALYDEVVGGQLRYWMGSLTAKNLPLSMFLETPDLGYPAWSGPTNKNVSNSDIKSSLGLGIVRFEEQPEEPEISTYDYEYRTNTEVITAVEVSGGQSDPDDPVTVRFHIDGTTYTVSNVYYPDGDSQLAWVRWTTPDEPQDMTIDVDVSGPGSAQATIHCKIVDLDENPPPNPVADDRNDSFTPSPVPDRPEKTSAQWTIWDPWWQEYWVWHGDDEDGYWCDHGWWEFDLDHYSASLSADMEITPDEKNPTASGNSMKSGYGVNQVVTARVSSSQRSATTALQNAVSYFPEFNYESFWRLLDRISISSSSSRLEFQKNEYSTYNRRTHFTPIWYPDGSYTVNTWVIDCWTPAGMLSVNLTDSLNIRGNLWDDWHIAPLDL